MGNQLPPVAGGTPGGSFFFLGLASLTGQQIPRFFPLTGRAAITEPAAVV